MGNNINNKTIDNARLFLMGKATAIVKKKKSVKAIVDKIVKDTII